MLSFLKSACCATCRALDAVNFAGVHNKLGLYEKLGFQLRPLVDVVSDHDGHPVLARSCVATFLLLSLAAGHDLHNAKLYRVRPLALYLVSSLCGRLSLILGCLRHRYMRDSVGILYKYYLKIRRHRVAIHSKSGRVVERTLFQDND
eukprot:SAG31_NODE_11405_length_1034_cov_1.857754_1_plen_147_part_00